MTTLLYRLYDSDENLLYTGITNSLKDRIGKHRDRWGDEIAKVSTVTFLERAEAEIAEAHAIFNERPRYNSSVNLRFLNEADPLSVPTQWYTPDEILRRIKKPSLGLKSLDAHLKLVRCPEDGYSVRVAKRWVSAGLPSCPEGHRMALVADQPDIIVDENR